MERQAPVLTIWKQLVVKLMERSGRLRPDWLQREFPEELRAICALAPMQSNPNLDRFLLGLHAIVYTFRARFEGANGAVRVVSALEHAIANIEKVIQGLGHFNAFALAAALPDVSEKCSQLKVVDAGQVFEQLTDTVVFLRALSEAMRSAASISVVPKRRGDKRKYDYVPALYLRWLWEGATGIEEIPHPKKLPKDVVEREKPKFISKQPSTEFIRLALRMINPAITDAQAMTAIGSTFWAMEKYPELQEEKNWFSELPRSTA
jgi:hypothetical protein